MSKNVGDAFQQDTKYHRGHLAGGRLDWAGKPDAYKQYPAAAKVLLDPPVEKGGPPLWTVVRQRRSVRDYEGTAMTRSELSQLLWAAQGITQRFTGGGLRTAPSAGALYPVETYLAVHSVEGVEPGIYHYGVVRHELEQLRQGDFRESVASAALDQDMAYAANVVFVWTALFQRSKWKYGQRAYRYVYLDAGHIAQNVALAAVALGLSSCEIGALYDDEVNALLGVDGVEESVVYMSAVGKR